MPFKGAIGPEMKKKAKTWAAETPNKKKLPEHKKASKASKANKAGSKGKKFNAGAFERARRKTFGMENKNA